MRFKITPGYCIENPTIPFCVLTTAQTGKGINGVESETCLIAALDRATPKAGRAKADFPL